MVRELLKSAANMLADSPSPLLDARVLLAHAMDKSDAALIFDMPDEKEMALFNEYIEKRKTGIPVSYIIGEKEFMGLRFKLNQDTLIPRPDTECLVEKVLELNNFSSPYILDLCTGSGCIGISLAYFLKDCRVDLTDISENALSEADKNAHLNGVSDRTKTFVLDVLNDEIKSDYDIIVSNPPYIETDVLSTLDVNRFEPHRALDGGADGLTFYKVIAEKAYSSLDFGGMLALEIGYNQAESVTSLLGKFSSVSLFKDYGNNDRVIIAVK